MVVYPADKWRLVRFEKSDKPEKKLKAVLKYGDKIKEIYFGQKGSSTFRNTSGIETGDPTHGDPKRRQAYRARHKGEGDPEKKYSPGYLSWWILWIAYFYMCLD